MARAGVGVFVAVVMAAMLSGGAPAARDTGRAVARERATASYTAMQQYFYSAATGSYTGVYPPRGHAQAWPFSQALWATVGAKPADVPARLSGLAAYSHPEQSRPAEYAPRYGGNGVVYNDDNLWIALALERLGDPGSLQTARNLYTLVRDGWDTDDAHPCPGGIFWTRLGANRDRNAVTTANAALLAVRLYARTGAKAYLGFAQQAYEWTERCLGRPDGLVADHIDLKGRIDGHTWSYNQGAMIAVGVRLYKATGKRRYLADAERTANRALATIGDPLASREPPVFLAIFFRDLHELTSVVPKRADRAAEEAFADEAWSRARDPRTGLFRFDGRQPTLLDQAAMVQVYAELAS